MAEISPESDNSVGREHDLHHAVQSLLVLYKHLLVRASQPLHVTTHPGGGPRLWPWQGTLRGIEQGIGGLSTAKH